MREKLNHGKRSLLRAIDMKSLTLIAAVAGLIVVSTGAVLANDTASATPAVPPAKKDSGHAVSAPAIKPAAPLHPPLQSPKPNLPVDAGRKQGTANIGGSTVKSGHKDGTLNGTEIKRHP